MQLQGGLGSQMWQYAVGRALALERDVELVLDVDQAASAEQNSYEGFALNKAFGIETRVLSRRDRLRLARWRRTPILRKRRFLHWKKVAFAPHLKDIGRHCYVSGPLNDYRYLSGYEPVIRSDFRKPASLTLDASLTAQMARSASVAIHVRRGDYQTASSLKLQPVEYYLAAAKRAQDDLASVDLHFFVFSDDIDWAASNLASLPDTTFVSPTSQPSWEALFLMSQCDHFIIANSTLSSWAAWLGQRRTSKVYYPRNWFTREKLNPLQMERMPAAWEPVDV